MADVIVKLSTPGVLLSSHAESYERFMIDLASRGITCLGTTQANHAMRSYQDQLDIWYSYMTLSKAASDKIVSNRRTWNGQTWWRKPGKVSCAKPGSSNHGKGNTVDFQGVGGYSSENWKRFAAVAAEHGWSNAEGKAINEPWHWTHIDANDKHKGDDDMPLNAADKAWLSNEIKTQLEKTDQTRQNNWIKGQFSIQNSWMKGQFDLLTTLIKSLFATKP